MKSRESAPLEPSSCHSYSLDNIDLTCCSGCCLGTFMSFIHLDKSIVTFHFKEILEDGHLGGPLTLVGLGALLLGPKLLSQSSSRAASLYRPGVSLSEWVKQQQAAASHAEGRPTLSLAGHSQDSDQLAA